MGSVVIETQSSESVTLILNSTDSGSGVKQIDIFVRNGNCTNTIKSKKASFYKPEAIYDFDLEDMDLFKLIIKTTHYDIIFFRFASMATLAEVSSEVSSLSKIIVDV